MKKKDLVETCILLLGLWFLYMGVSTFAVMAINVSFDFFFNDYSEQVGRYIMVNFIFTLSYLTGMFICFKKSDWLIQNTQLQSEEQTLLSDNLISKRDILETGIVIVSLALFFQNLPDLLKNIIFFFKSRAGNEYLDFEFTEPFLLVLIPLLAVIMKDKLADMLYFRKKNPDKNV